MVDGVLHLAACLKRVRGEGVHDEARVLSTVGLQGSNEEVVAVSLTGVFTTEVTTEETELATWDVHADPLVHTLEVLDEGGRVLAGAEGEACEASHVLGESA